MYVSPPIQCVPFWPELTNKKLQMLAKVKDTKEETKAFYMNQAHTTLLPLNNDVSIHSLCGTGQAFQPLTRYKGRDTVKPHFVKTRSENRPLPMMHFQ